MKYRRFGYIYLYFPGREITLISPLTRALRYSVLNRIVKLPRPTLYSAIYALRLLIIPGDSGIRRRIPGLVFFCLTGAALLLYSPAIS